MNLQSIEYFVAVGKTLSITAAAEKLFVTQPAMSRQIQGLEAELGVKLFERTKPLLTLTEDGEFLLDHAMQILQYIERMEKYAHKQLTQRSGYVKIGFERNIAVEFLTHFVAMSAIQFPNVEFSFEEEDSTVLFSNLNKGKYDMIFAAYPEFALEQFGFDAFNISDSGCSAAVSVHHPLASKNEIELKELANDYFVIFPRRNAQIRADQLVHWCSKAGFSPKIKYEVQSMAEYMLYIAANQAVSIVTNDLKASVSNGITLLPVRDLKEMNIPIGIIWQRGNLRPLCKIMIDTLG